jgi:pimeloyl-ACP methyl ester carboxylesterase
LVVLLHGFPETALLSWHYQIGPLADAGFHVVVPDQRGYNTSDKPEGVHSYAAAETTADVIGLLDHYNANSAYITGHDWGAMVAWRVAIFHPDRVKKLVILNVPHPGVFMPYLQSHPSQLLKSWYIFFFQLPFLPEFLFTRENFRAGRSLMEMSSIKGKTFTTDVIPLYVQGWSQPNEVEAMINWYRASIRIDAFKPKLDKSRVRPDTLILWGEKDVALEAGMVEPSLALCDNGKAIYFPEASHWVQHDEPTHVSQHLIDFFRNE